VPAVAAIGERAKHTLAVETATAAGAATAGRLGERQRGETGEHESESSANEPCLLHAVVLLVR
jgi:hypothetical protein